MILEVFAGAFQYTDEMKKDGWEEVVVGFVWRSWIEPYSPIRHEYPGWTLRRPVAQVKRPMLVMRPTVTKAPSGNRP